MENKFAITTYPNAAEITKQLDELIKKPIYTIKPEALKAYEEEYYEKKCKKSKEMIEKAKEIIPGGVQHNLAFNYPFPLVFTKAEGAKLYDIDGNEYLDFLQAGGPTVLGSNPPEVREQVIDLLKTCGPSTGLFHEFEYKLAKKISDNVETVQMFRMLGSVPKPAWQQPSSKACHKEEEHNQDGRSISRLERPACLRHQNPRLKVYRQTVFRSTHSNILRNSSPMTLTTLRESCVSICSEADRSGLY